MQSHKRSLFDMSELFENSVLVDLNAKSVFKNRKYNRYNDFRKGDKMDDVRIWSIFDFYSFDDDEVTIEDKKNVSKIIKDARSFAKMNVCFHCCKEVESFCNSHSVPAYSLRNIAKEGKLLTLNQFLKTPHFDLMSGIKSSGVFKIICRKCDNELFSHYENPNNYDNDNLEQALISQIAIKNHLNAISKKHIEIEMLKAIPTHNGVDMYKISKELDLLEYKTSYNLAKKNLEKGWDEFYVVYYQILDYTVPIAFQDEVNLIMDFDGRVINDIYNYDPSYHIKGIHICVFPLIDKSVIIMFTHKNHVTRYRSFYRSFRKKSNEEKLEIINFIILAYSENFYLSPYLPQSILNDKKLISVTKLCTLSVFQASNISYVNELELIMKEYDYEKSKSIPNFLNIDIRKLEEKTESIKKL